MQVIEYDEWIEQTDRQTAQQIALLAAQSGVDGIVDLDNVAAFPSVGVEGYLYLAKDTGKLYSWNATDEEYVRVDSGSDYILPVATGTVLGGVKVGDNISVTEGGVASAYIFKEIVRTIVGPDVVTDSDNVIVGTGSGISNFALTTKQEGNAVDTYEVVELTVPNTTAAGTISLTLDGNTKTVVFDGPKTQAEVIAGIIALQSEPASYPNWTFLEISGGVRFTANTFGVYTSSFDAGTTLDTYNVILPSALTVGRIIKIKNVGEKSMLIIPDGSNTIDGLEAIIDLSEFEATTLLCYETGKWCEL